MVSVFPGMSLGSDFSQAFSTTHSIPGGRVSSVYDGHCFPTKPDANANAIHSAPSPLLLDTPPTYFGYRMTSAGSTHSSQYMPALYLPAQVARTHASSSPMHFPVVPFPPHSFSPSTKAVEPFQPTDCDSFFPSPKHESDWSVDPCMAIGPTAANCNSNTSLSDQAPSALTHSPSMGYHPYLYPGAPSSPMVYGRTKRGSLRSPAYFSPPYSQPYPPPSTMRSQPPKHHSPAASTRSPSPVVSESDKLQAMMATFTTRAMSTTPKRYKCEICMKKFTRPSSLQTHRYSHTGEKPFQCPVEGCGRHFSVVSNLRRHAKIHT